MNHALTCHLPAAAVMLIASIIGVKMLFPQREFSTPEMTLISAVALAVSLGVSGALHV